MPKARKPWYARLRGAVEACEKKDGDKPFAELVAAVLEDTEDPFGFLSQAAGFTDEDRSIWIRGWATGAIRAPKFMRRKIIRTVRRHFARAFEGP
jgi:hypothetical protein